MPELPEVETIKKGLATTILNKTIKRVEVRLPKAVSIGPKTVSNIRRVSKAQARRFAKLVQGQRFQRIQHRGKLLVMDLSGHYTLLVHLKMTGQLIFADKSELPKKAKILNLPDARWLTLPHVHTHVVFHFQSGSKLYFNDMRQFGHMRLVHDKDLAKVREFKEYGPEPFSKDFDFSDFLAKARGRSITIKQFLVDQGNMAGIGNIYSDEILYCAKVRPRRKARRLNLTELKAVFTCVPKVLRQAIKMQGSSVGDYFKVDGTEGRFGLLHKVYGRGGEKCKKCGRIIKSVKLGGRTSSYCPNCQK